MSCRADFIEFSVGIVKSSTGAKKQSEKLQQWLFAFAVIGLLYYHSKVQSASFETNKCNKKLLVSYVEQWLSESAVAV